MSDEQRAADDKIYGIERNALNDGGPSVISVNGVVASLAVTEFMAWRTGIRAPVGYLNYRGDMARAGIDFREYKGPQTLHSKSIVVDGRLAMIGSYNIDPRSHFLNTEVMCVMQDEAFARELLQSVGADEDDSWAVDPRSADMPFRILALQLLMPILEHQL